jgi:hypothetical protein
MTSDGVPRPLSAGPRDKITTREQTWSKHGPETAFSWPSEMGITPVQNGCAARDSNPEPAVKSPLLCVRLRPDNVWRYRFVRDSAYFATAWYRARLGRTGTPERTRSTHGTRKV